LASAICRLKLPETTDPWKMTVKKESLLFLSLLLTGVFVLPAAIYLVGRAMFGEYGGTGFPAFYGMLQSELWSGEPSVWFLILSPYLVWQLLRLTLHAFRRSGGS
jgi:hypothetical protein